MGSECLVAAFRGSLCQYNPQTADRRARVDVTVPNSSAAYAWQTLAGPLVAVGTFAGTVELFAPDTLRRRATLRRREEIEAQAVEDSPGRVRCGAAACVGHGGSIRSSPLTPLIPSFPLAPPPRSVLPVTCTAFLGHDLVAAGTAAGSVHLFSLRTGREVGELAVPPSVPAHPGAEGADAGAGAAPDPATSATATVCAIVAADSGDTPMVVVGLGSGTVHVFHRDSAAWLRTLALPPDTGPAAALATLPAWNVLLHVGMHSTRIALWDVRDLGEPSVLQPAEAREEAGAGATALAVDTERGLLIAGAQDGSFAVRQLWRGDKAHAAAQETGAGGAEAAANAGAVSLRTLRLFAPANRAPGSTAAPTASRAAAWITALHYAAEEDALVVGDAAGYVRLVRAVTGDAPAALTPALARAIERHRRVRREAIQAALKAPSVPQLRRRARAKKGYAAVGVAAGEEEEEEHARAHRHSASPRHGAAVAEADSGAVLAGGERDDTDLFLAAGARAERGRGGGEGEGKGSHAQARPVAAMDDEVERAVDSVFWDSEEEEEEEEERGRAVRAQS